MRKLLIILGTILVLLFLSLGITNIINTNNRLHLREVQLKSINSNLVELESKYNVLNKDLDKANADKTTSAATIKQLNDEKALLEQKKAELESQLQARIDAKNKLALASQSVINTATNTSYANAASGDSAKMFIYARESGNNPGAINASSGACGLGQALPCSKLPCSLSDYVCQDNWFTNNYMIPRYGSWDNAKAFWLSHSWW